MAVPRRWKLVSGSVGVAVALGAGAAVAAEGGSSGDLALDDVKKIHDVVTTTSTTFIQSPEPIVVMDESVSTPFDDEVAAPADDESIDSPDDSPNDIDDESIDSPDDSPNDIDDESIDSPDSLDSP
jgi:hypothetical protein